MSTASTPRSSFSAFASVHSKSPKYSSQSKKRAIALHRLSLVALFSSLAMVVAGEGAIAQPVEDQGPGNLGTQVDPQGIDDDGK